MIKVIIPESSIRQLFFNRSSEKNSDN